MVAAIDRSPAFEIEEFLSAGAREGFAAIHDGRQRGRW